MIILIGNVFSLGGHQPFIPNGLYDDESKKNASSLPINSSNNQSEWKQRARVLCSYDAKDSTELNLSANEVSRIRIFLRFPARINKLIQNSSLNIQIHIIIINNNNPFKLIQQIIFVTECNPVNGDYMYGKQGLINGLVPRAFLELLQE